MKWKVTQEELVLLAVSIPFGDFDDQQLPKDVVWDYWTDGSLDLEKITQKLKDMKIPKDMVEGIRWKEYEYSAQNVYYIKWPKNISKLIFRNFWEVVLKKRQFHGALFMDMLFRDVIVLAEAVDSASEDTSLSNQMMVKGVRKELRETEPAIELLEEAERSDANEGTHLQGVDSSSTGDGGGGKRGRGSNVESVSLG